MAALPVDVEPSVRVGLWRAIPASAGR